MCALALAGAFAARSVAAGEPVSEGRRIAGLVRRARPGVVMLKTATGICSGVVLEDGVIASSKDRLRAAGRVTAFAFPSKKTEDGREVVDRVELGEAKVERIHRSADAALLRLAGGSGPAKLAPLPSSRSAPRADLKVVVCGVQGAVRFDDALDLDARGGAVLEGAGPPAGVVPISAPAHVNSSGGAILDAKGGLLGMASRRVHEGVPGGMVPVARFKEMLSGRHALSPAKAAEHVRARPGPPPRLKPSSEGPEGKRVALGHGAFAVKESRAVLASGVVVLDQHEPLEYVWCPIRKGKLHETIIASDADPTKLNFALMMLGYESGGGVEELGDTSAPLGDKVRVFVEWDWNEAAAIREYLGKIEPAWKRPQWKEVLKAVEEGAVRWKPGAKTRVRIEDLVFDRIHGRPMPHIDWVYTGGRFGRDEETGRHYFEAAENGVFAAVYRDPSAVLNNPLKGGMDDTYYCVNDTMSPPRGTRCTLIILPSAPKAAPEE